MNESMKEISPENRVNMVGIWKRFPGVIANQDVNFILRAGEVHALLGENGAGKTTLMNILAGIYQQDAGEISINGKITDIRSPTDAYNLGIGMVHQHFRLVDNLTVPENIHLGWKRAPWHSSRQSLAKRIKEQADLLGFTFDPTTEVWQLSVGEQQRAEILRALVRGAEILILDEPTAVLTPEEADELFKVIRRLVKQNHTIVFISHKLNEVLEVSDRVTVLKDGKNVATLNTSDCDLRSLANLMVGRDIVLKKYSRDQEPAEIMLKARNLSALNDQGQVAVSDLNFEIRGGEIFGIAGVSGNGQTELAEILTGVRSLENGRIEIAGKEIRNGSPREFCLAGVGHIPEDRNSMGLFPDLSLTHNAILRKYSFAPIRKGVNINPGAAERFTRKLIDRGDVRTPGLEVPAANLSGGNQQKLLVQREIDIASHLLVAVHPTRGLDISAIEDVRKELVDHRDSGNSVLLISEDLDEIMMLADRIAVMYEGKIVGTFKSEEADREKIGLLMGGKIEGNNDD